MARRVNLDILELLPTIPVPIGYGIQVRVVREVWDAVDIRIGPHTGVLTRAEDNPDD